MNRAADGSNVVWCGSDARLCGRSKTFWTSRIFRLCIPDILGAEPLKAVNRYEVEIRDYGVEVWAVKISFCQPQAAKGAEGGIQRGRYSGRMVYRVPAPTAAVLYKTGPVRPGAFDVIAIFVQPLSDELCDVWPWMALYDNVTPQAALIQFQQMIFVQDRAILENQLPRLLPLDPGWRYRPSPT